MRGAYGNTYQAQSNGNCCHFTAKKEKCGKNQPYFPLNGACWSTAVHLISKVHLSPMLARRRERAQVQLSFTSHTV